MLDELDTDTQQFVQQEEPAKAPVETQAEVAAKQESKEQNLRILRERAEAAERRSQELERMIQMNMSQNQQSVKMQVVEEEDDFDLADDAYAEGKHVKKYVKNLRQELKNTKKQFEEFTQRSSIAQAEMRLKSEFNDFDQVVSKENLERLSTLKPALFRSVMANQDIYDRGYTAYELIKNAGIVSEDYSAENKRLEANKNKPRSAANVAPQTGETPLARVGDYDRRVLTEERKAQLCRQVEEAKRNKI